MPAELNAEVLSLGQQLTTNQLASDRLAGLDRLIDILVYRKLTPVFVMEDTEAVVGATDGIPLAERFFVGPVKAFLQEVDAALLIAVQSHIARQSTVFAQLAPTMRCIDLPHLEAGASEALTTIAAKRLRDNGLEFPVEDVLSEGCLNVLVAWYDETGRNLRFTLAALQSAADHAADAGANAIEASHMRMAAAEWRARTSNDNW